jgi:NAD dependent epimerase/dehydratase family enzyme
VMPRVAERSGYRFKYTELDRAIAAVLAAPSRAAD